MNRIRLSLALKLKLIIICVTTIVLSLSFIYIIYNQININKIEISDHTSLNAKLIGEFCVSPLLFDDHKGCNDILAKAETIPDIIEIAVLDTNNNVFAKFSKNNSNILSKINIKMNDTTFFENDLFIIKKSIIYDNIYYGKIVVISDDNLISHKFNRFIWFMIILLISSIIVSYFIANYFQRIISKPILNLAKFSKSISVTGDFNQTIDIKYEDEIGILYREFNNLMYEIVVRNNEKEKNAQEITKLNEELEAKVLDRTSKLIELLMELEQENKQRKINEILLKKLNEELEINKISIEEDSKKLLELNKKLTFSENNLKELISTKDRFFSILAHDLKNPISGVMMLSGLLIKHFHNFSNEQKENHLIKIQEATKNVYDLLENLLNWGRLLSNNIPFMPEECNIKDIIVKTLDMCSSLAYKKQILLQYEIHKDEIIFADINMISTILRNLIINAIKFSNNNEEILVTFDKDDNFSILKVKDNGIGISKSDQEKLFRLDIIHTKYGTANEKGSGLGLVICKEFVDKHNGSLYIESEVNNGSTFTVKIPNL